MLLITRCYININILPSSIVYDYVQLSEEAMNQIYTPGEEAMARSRKRGWGVVPDFAIKNTVSGKILFGEIKRQDGWVEGKDPSAGRGNVHECMCKLFTPGLMEKYRLSPHHSSHKAFLLDYPCQHDLLFGYSTIITRRNNSFAIHIIHIYISSKHSMRQI